MDFHLEGCHLFLQFLGNHLSLEGGEIRALHVADVFKNEAKKPNQEQGEDAAEDDDAPPEHARNCLGHEGHGRKTSGSHGQGSRDGGESRNPGSGPGGNRGKPGSASQES